MSILGPTQRRISPSILEHTKTKLGRGAGRGWTNMTERWGCTIASAAVERTRHI